jgi:DNA-binding FadR family transcriptional regulator
MGSADRPDEKIKDVYASASFALSAVRVPKTAEVVADQIRRKIIRGEIAEGDALPPESQLMESLSISRPTLREAIRILEAERLISVARGSRTGARVHRPSVESVARYAGFALQAQGTTIADIYEARLAIEPFVAHKLAVTKPAEAGARLRIEVDRLLELIDAERYTEFIVGLAEFHRVLVELWGNRTLLLLVCMLQEIVERHQVHSLTRQAQAGTAQRRVRLSGVRSFQKLIGLIEAGDGPGAAAHWQLHLENSNKAWLEGVEEASIIDVFE